MSSNDGVYITLYGKQHVFIELSKVQFTETDRHLIFFVGRKVCETNIFVFQTDEGTVTL